MKILPSLEFTKLPSFVNYAKKLIFTTNPFTILLYNQIQIYFHIWLKISVKTKILLVANAPLSLVNLYAKVTKKRPIFRSGQSIGTVIQGPGFESRWGCMFFTLVVLIQINRFSVSNLHGRPRKNNHHFGISENIKLGLINYTLLGLIEHHGVFIDSGHYVSYIRQSNKWYHCDDKHITETNLLTLSNNVYLMFYAREVDLGT